MSGRFAVGRIEKIHVKTKIYRLVGQNFVDLAQHRAKPACIERRAVNQTIAHLAGVLKNTGNGYGTASANVKGLPGVDQPFLSSPGKGGGRVITLMFIFTVARISIGMCIDVKHYQIGIPAMQGPELRQRD